MFNNLIESSSHGRELRRRGSFLLLTTASYALLFTIVGVVSIHAYEAKMEDQNLQLVTLLPPVLAPPPEEVRRPDTPNNPGNHTGRQPVDVRRDPTAPIDRVERPPDTISTRPNPSLPVRNVPYVIGDRDINADAGRIVGPGTPGSGSSPQTNRIITEIEPPPAVATPRQIPKVVSKGVITGEALSLPRPAYPPIALQSGTQGVVSVQVLIDESGKVISAKVMSGHPFLAPAAVRAAYQARFKPTTLSEQPVKVSGVITYNFNLQR